MKKELLTALVDRFARSMIIKNTTAAAMGLFHVDVLPAPVPMKIDLDV